MLRRTLASFVMISLVACSALKTANEADAAPPGGDEDGGTADASSSDAAPEGPDAATCVKACGGRACGLDPACGETCGQCAASLACDATDAGATCRAATIVWELDGKIVTQKTTHEAFYSASQGTYSIFFPHYGRNVQLALPANPAAGTLASCPGGGTASVGLVTSDNSWAGLEALPARWKSLSITTCGVQSSGDTVTARDLTITSVSPARIAGTYEIIIHGAGPRAGSTLRVHGVFDVTPQQL